MQLGLVTYNLAKDWDVETILQKREAARFEAVELRTSHKHGVEPSLSKAEREKERRAAAKAPGPDDGKKARRDAEERERAVQVAETKVAELELTLANPALYGDADGARKAGSLNTQLEVERRELELAMERWVQ